ncbi:MAG TPA: thioredoxin-disulfide reductase [Tepidiformaceae bacterium]|nr:thioredoxin-disulfide reductase [Tepidiformaceae bacterium]
MEQYDVAIVGGGGAGLTAALYTARARRRTIVFEGEVMGGQIATTDIVENYPGFPDGINGFDLAQLIHRQAEKFGAETAYERVEGIERLADGAFELRTTERAVRARAVVMTAGAAYNKLGVPGEAELTGRGVSYCGTCDAAFFGGMDVIVVGGGDSALDEGMFVARYARTVNVVHRRDTLRASAILQERAFATPNMRFTWNTVVERIEGEGQVERAVLRNVETGEVSTVPTSGVFIFIGQTPNNHLLAGLTELDAGGHAVVDLQMRTRVPGLFVAGDLRTQAARQLISAAGDGATAAISAEHYLAGLDGQGAAVK